WVSIPSTVFDLHVLPILTRALEYRWVNAGAMRAQTGHRHTAWVDQLAKVRDPADPDGRRLRRMLFAHIREVPTPASTRHPVQALMPRLHDHEYEHNADGSSVTVLPFTAVQYTHLKNWADDNFLPTAQGQAETVCSAMDRVAL